ncbi:MAG: HK97 family phage prohead protease [Acidobacteria bacterium]|nr:HK97 family phage prohead protease [Acidobacteriota bacterium]
MPPFAKSSMAFTVTAGAAGVGEAAVTITTDGIDRSRDRVMPQGCQLGGYLKNPVVLFGHDYSSIPVGTCTAIEATANGLKATWKWLTGDPFAERVKNAWDQGILRAASIGFNPMKWAYDEERRGYDFLEWDLLEFSIVPVPANAEAVRAAGLPVNEPAAVTVKVDTADLQADIRALIARLDAATAQKAESNRCDACGKSCDCDKEACAHECAGCASDCPCAMAKQASEGLAITLEEDADADVLTLDADAPDDIAINADELRTAIADVLAAELSQQAAGMARAAILAASGRID